MPIPQFPSPLRNVMAHAGDVVEIPEITPPGTGALSYSDGWPPITSLPLEAGGLAPERAGFNAVYKLLSAHVFFQQSGGVYPWMGANGDFPGLNYLAGAHVLGRDGAEYVALAPSGPEVPGSGGGFVGPVDPVGGADGYWLAVSGLSWTAASTYPSPCLRLHGGKVWLWLAPSGPGIPGVGSKEPGADGSAGYWGEFSAGGGGGGETSPPGYLSEFRNFFEQTVPTGWAVRNGAVLANASATVPKLLAYLQQPENAWKCKSLEEWTALSNAAGGVGGVPFFVVDTAANTIKLPDTRGDYERGAGSSYLETVGAWHPDAVRDITGSFGAGTDDGRQTPLRWGSGAFSQSGAASTGGYWNPAGSFPTQLNFAASRMVPTASENRVRTFAVLPCVYVGVPT